MSSICAAATEDSAAVVPLRNLTLDLEPLRASRDFRYMWIGATISSVGTQFTRISVPWLVYQQTGSLVALGAIGAITLVPMLVCSVVGGAIADIFDRRNVSRLSALVGAVTSLLHVANVTFGNTQLWAVYALHVIGTSLLMGGAPAARSALPFIVDKERLTSALMLQSTTYTTSSVLGPAVGGFIITSLGVRWAFLIDAVTFAFSFACWTRIKPIPPMATGARMGVPVILDGFRALRGHRPIVGSFLADLNAMVFGMPMALFPAIAVQRWPDHGNYYGLLAASIPFGMFVATVFSGWTRNVTRHGMVIVVSIVVWGTAITIFGFVSGLLASCACLAVAGAADMISGVSRNAMLQLSASPELQGRIQGVGMAVWTAGPALGDAEAGGVAALTSVNTSIWLGGLACMGGIAAIAIALPEFLLFRVSTRRDEAHASADDGAPAGAIDPLPVVPTPTE
jgi:MFS family permease